MQKAGKGRYLGVVHTSRALTNFVLVESEYAADQELSWHSHDTAFISIGLEGSYVERCGSSSLYCDVGQVIFHTAGELHSNRFFERGARSMNLEILPHFADRLRQYGMDTRTRLTLCGHHFVELGRRLQAEALRYDAVSELAIEALGMEVLTLMVRTRALEERSRKSNWVELVRAHLDERYRENLTLKEIAEEAQVHPVHLARAFRKRYECSIGDYVRRRRVAAACREISTSDAPMAEIAAQNGFSDQSHLCRAVKEHMGISPIQLRRSGTRRG